MCAAIIAKYDAGVKVAALKEEFRCRKTAIYDTINRWKNHKTLHSLPRSGRPRVLSCRKKRILYRIAQKSPTIEYKKLMGGVGLTTPSNTYNNIPYYSTIYRALKENGLVNWRCKLALN
jgi:transposase